MWKCWKLWQFLLKKYHDNISCSFPYKLVCVDNKFTKPIVVYRGENASYEFIKAIFKEYQYCQKTMKNLTKICSWVKKKNNPNRGTRVGCK